MDQNSNGNGQQVPPRVDLRKQAPQEAQRSYQTAHIDVPEAEPAKPAKPPTVVFKPSPIQGMKAGDRLQTMEINPADLEQSAPSTAPAQNPTVSIKPLGPPAVPGAAPVSKRETSRIPLEMAKPPLGTAAKPVPGPTTIRVKPVVIRQTVDLAQAVPDSSGAAPQAAPAVAAPPPVPPASGKSKTSRISLESVLGAQPGVSSQTAEITPPEGDDEPRTIRIKRASERPTVQKSAGAAPQQPAPQPTLGQTARLELPPETPPIALAEAGGQSPTRKKTIKVRRPGMEGEEEGAPAAVARPQPVAQPTTTDVPHWAFGVVASLTVLVFVVLIWVLMAQTFGRNISLTTLSYGWPECDLHWFGKILPAR
jgi:hypothetical protein